MYKQLKIFDESPHAERIDAVSRVDLYGINAIGSKEIAQYGNVTNLSDDSCTFGDGFIALEMFSGIPSAVEMLPDGSRQQRYTLSQIPLLELLIPDKSEEEVQNYCLHLCDKLGLNTKDPDKISGYFSRCFTGFDISVHRHCGYAESPSLLQTISLNNVFAFNIVSDSILELWDIFGYKTIVEIKYFKNDKHPEIISFPFKPTKSSLRKQLYSKYIKQCYITSELGGAMENEDHIWLHNCGDFFDEMDFSAIKTSVRPIFSIMEFDEDKERTRKAFAEAVSFKAAALRKGITIAQSIVNLQPTGKKETFNGTLANLLKDEELVRRCIEMGIHVDRILSGSPYELKIDRKKRSLEAILPGFIDKGGLSIFQDYSDNFYRNLLTLLAGKKQLSCCSHVKIKTMAIFKKGATFRTQKLFESFADDFTLIEDSALFNDGLIPADAIQQLVSEYHPKLMILKFSDYKPAHEDKLIEALDTALSLNIACAVFCTNGDVPPKLESLADNMLVVGDQEDNIFIIKHKSKNDCKIMQYNFTDVNVIVSNSSEEDLMKFIN